MDERDDLTLGDRQTRQRQSYREALAAYSGMSDAELRGVINGLEHDLGSADELAEASAEVHRLLVGDYLAAALHVQAQRTRRYAEGTGTNPRAETQAAWMALADEVHERADITSLLERFGWPVRSAGRHEWCAPCLECGGDDRMRVFLADDRVGFPRVWCRQCSLSTDAIGVLRLLNGAGYFDAVADLATDLGLSVPDSVWPSDSSRRSPRGSRRDEPSPRFVPFEFVRGEVVR